MYSWHFSQNNHQILQYKWKIWDDGPKDRQTEKLSEWVRCASAIELMNKKMQQQPLKHVNHKTCQHEDRMKWQSVANSSPASQLVAYLRRRHDFLIAKINWMAYKTDISIITHTHAFIRHEREQIRKTLPLPVSAC